jgi:hypothetical protein
MDWNVLVPAMFSLAGVAIGAGGSLAAAFFATRAGSEHVRTRQRSELREERKAVLLDYLRAAQESHDHAARLWGEGPDLPDEIERREAIRLDREMWYQQKKLLIFATAPLRSASVSWTELLSRALQSPRSTEGSFWDCIEPVQSDFLEAARVDLGIADESETRHLPSSPRETDIE